MEIKDVVLIEPESPGYNFFSSVQMPLLGLPILGAILQQMGLNVKIYCENFSSIDWNRIKQADIIGLTVLTLLAPRAYELAQKIKEVNPRAKIIMGGVHVSMLPEEALNHGADIVVRGEGENIIRNLIQALAGKNDIEDVAGISYCKNGKIHHNKEAEKPVDLGKIPAPDFSLIENYKEIPYIPYQTSRGCPHNCEFCSVVEMFGRNVRDRPPAQVIKDLKSIKKTPAQKDKHVFIVDDNFSANIKRARDLLQKLSDSNLEMEWSTQEEVLVHKKEEILDLMAKTGCKRLHLGIESVNPDALEEYQKPQSRSDIYKAVEKIKKRDISVHGMFVLGADNDTARTIRETMQAAVNLDLETAQFFVLVPPPGTELFRRLKEEGRLLIEEMSDWKFFDGQHVVFEPNNLAPTALQKLQIKAFKKFYNLKQSLKWFTRKKFYKGAVNFYGIWALRRWLWENRGYLDELKDFN
ncbi:B12-binding domain-containing radical SAM protein [Halarsenatibacter silvermanii]|uniref:Radical SAM superfamily enzyme YgiQ, UPF0313 family n=1 Tax=Halarsenatibacter silvermanii TaxID=321763 RepID=A0A1G9TKF0_9FIRM|nr:radical SAM protein [Halarsenatibacter silvermanii]SDM47894.1 Radical SAM superfamily enzyme YgiQ, UPF0313 family [Halarsenatibacter silvermanii]